MFLTWSTSVVYRSTLGIELWSPDSHPTLLTTRLRTHVVEKERKRAKYIERDLGVFFIIERL